MQLLTCLVTYNRLAYTKRTLDDYLSTVSVPSFLVVVDNASSDGTQDYLRKLEKEGRIDKVILNAENYYPGRACNIGWLEGLKEFPDATHLARLDNDLSLNAGWCEEAVRCFAAFPDLGQLGLDHGALEPETRRVRRREVRSSVGSCTINPFPGNVGGPCIIRRELWDEGLRYSETRWSHRGRWIPAIQEDVVLSEEVAAMGYRFGHMTKSLVRTFAQPENWTEFPEYYQQTMDDRGYRQWFPELYGSKTSTRWNDARRLAIRVAAAPFHFIQLNRIRRQAQQRVRRRRQADGTTSS